MSQSTKTHHRQRGALFVGMSFPGYQQRKSRWCYDEIDDYDVHIIMRTDFDKEQSVINFFDQNLNITISTKNRRTIIAKRSQNI